MDQRLSFVDIVRRGYGRRYTWLPVDRLDRDGFAADFNGAYLRASQLDIQIGDLARWRDGDSYLQARIAAVAHENEWVLAHFEAVEHISAEIYYG
jgi:hypothetical protein